MNSILQSKRNYGLDVLKCISMLGVVVLHCLSAGGILENVVPLSTNFNVAWFLEIVCLHSVNIFAIITGYVSIKSKHVWTRLADLWISVIFYSILSGIASFLVNDTELSELIFSAFPVTNANFWYFCSYVVIWLFLPYINQLVLSLNKKQHLTLILIALTLFSIVNFVGEIFDFAPFIIKHGYSPTWLLTLYFIGTYLNRYKEAFDKIKKSFCLLSFLVSVLVLWSSNYLLTFIGGDIATRVLTILKTYPSLPLVFGAISLVLFFAKLNIKHCKRFITTFSASSFFVYIIHSTPFFWGVITGRIAFAANSPWYMLIFATFALAISIYVFCMATDLLRQKLFKLLRINKIYDLVVKILFTCFNRVREFLLSKI